ncbi:Trans-1,2-dihydrobenzene-1,2-diol dehydrogenase [Colletotrichum tanaceti]|uniref:D-xylose 1-dehydrogenase (NADP(+), D-xylono-1,5-lactone-forming) n=1 Tax=Colletotrichum tanaceti TaxID=1306861 RepID=A0A4U6X3N2_9PEZI|nr:Trans-1,2-dihydrobenzene-1,2-diol dehydrogenase [Colletotrichum tanaceti]TKW49523.1 Trans-1,2-dihydrobenzene-1,2-diol dehydrogenase [Colletotrichum tanaceti]
MAPHTVNWGIMATGWIAETFCKDLLTNPASRDVTDVAHRIAALSSSRDAQKARDFVRKIDAPAETTVYGSYAELVRDPNVDIIYVATPHSHHFQNAMLALDAGKHVLCEKALTVTAEQTRVLVETARAKKLFFMEAVWTRYFPLSIKVRELISSGAIGKVYRTTADLSFNNCTDGSDKLSFADSHRMVNPELAGGALLDLGIYSLTWLFQTLYHLQPEKESPEVLASVQKYAVTGADESTTMILNFPKNQQTGIATTSLRVDTAPDGKGSTAPAIRIQGSKGEIQVAHPAFRPLSYKVVKKGVDEVEVVDCPIPTDEARQWGHGMFWEADECARCLRDGKLESASLPLSESLVIMETMDSAIKQGGIQYPELITSHEFDAKSPLNLGNA